MRKQWLGIGIAAGLLAACSNNENGQPQQQAPQPAVCNGPTMEISGAEPHYEPLNPTANQNYQRNGKSYQVVQDPSRFTQAGLAAIAPDAGNTMTASGEAYDAMQLTAAHPTLPIPSYARITNLANGRMIVVRINDRGPFDSDRVIALSRASADRLNTSNNTKVRIDPIIVAAEGSLSGPGIACTTIAKQTYALPARPDLNSGLGSASSAPVPPATQGDVRAISNAGLVNASTAERSSESSGMLAASAATGAAAISSAVSSAETPMTASVPVNMGNSPNEPVTAPGSIQGSAESGAAVAAPAPVSQASSSAAPASASGGYMVQVGAVSDEGRAQQFLQKLKQQYSVPGTVTPNGAVYRILLGPFDSRDAAASVQQRLLTDMNQQSFIKATAP